MGQQSANISEEDSPAVLKPEGSSQQWSKVSDRDY